MIVCICNFSKIESDLPFVTLSWLYKQYTILYLFINEVVPKIKNQLTIENVGIKVQAHKLDRQVQCHT